MADDHNISLSAVPSKAVFASCFPFIITSAAILLCSHNGRSTFNYQMVFSPCRDPMRNQQLQSCLLYQSLCIVYPRMLDCMTHYRLMRSKCQSAQSDYQENKFNPTPFLTGKHVEPVERGDNTVARSCYSAACCPMTLQLMMESHRRLQKPAPLWERLEQCIWN